MVREATAPLLCSHVVIRDRGELGDNRKGLGQDEAGKFVTSETDMHDTEEFWEELLAQIEAGGVIPVVGPELLTVVADGRSIPFYQLLAERLLAKYGLTAS